MRRLHEIIAAMKLSLLCFSYSEVVVLAAVVVVVVLAVSLLSSKEKFPCHAKLCAFLHSTPKEQGAEISE